MAYSKKVDKLTYYNGRQYKAGETVTFLVADEQLAAKFYGDTLPDPKAKPDPKSAAPATTPPKAD